MRRMRIFGRTPFILLLGLPLFLYAALPSRNFYWDGVAFAINIEKRLPPADLLHPNHLLYALCGSWLFRLGESVGIHLRALFMLQTANSLLAGLCVILLYKCLRLNKVAPSLSAAGSLLFAFSATWWRFAIDANAYVPSIFFLLCAYILVRNPRTMVLAAFAHAGAMLFHELAILYLPVALLSLERSRRSISTYAAAALIPVMTAYAAAYRAVSGDATIQGFFSWVTSHSSDSGFSFNPFTSSLLTLRGSFRLLFGGRLGDFRGDEVSIGVLIALAIAAILFFLYLRRALQGFQVASPPLHLLMWAGVYLAFLFFWMPQNTFYRLFYLPPLIGILLTILRNTPRIGIAIWLFIPILLLWNFAFVIYPQSRVDSNAPLRFALAQGNRWPAGTPIVFHQFHPDLWTISYFNPQAAWIGLPDANPDRLESHLEYARKENKPLWLEGTAFDLIASDAKGQQWLKVHEQPKELIQFRDAKHEYRFHCMR